VPTVPPAAPEFNPVRYWRGPVWINVNWLVRSGLSRYGQEMEAERIRTATLELIAAGGMAEYFDPISGAAHGAVPFSWTAALCLEMIQEKGKSA
jgi:glycogen debranching enzyme